MVHYGLTKMCTEKEIQLLKLDKFDNICLGLDGFHTKKVVLACIGKFLEGSGVEEILV